jgi:hypothetical protein
VLTSSPRARKALRRPLSSARLEFDDCLLPPPGLEVDPDWAETFLGTFGDVRQSLRRWAATPVEKRPPTMRLPALTDVQAWQRICGWGDQPSRAERPSMSTLLALDLLSVQTLVQLTADWLDEAWEADGRNALRQPRALWLFALLGRLDADLLADTASRLRQIFRTLTRVRARYARGEAASERVAEVNMLVLIVARHFRQAAPGEC